MCGRFTISATEEELEKRFGADFYTKVLAARYNITPSQDAPVITNLDPHHILMYRWGLIPFWAKEAKVGYKMINARSETVSEKASFRIPFKSKRCLVLADGYYEWKRNGKVKTPYWIHLKRRKPFAFGGLWEEWRAPDGEPVFTFTIITLPASPGLAEMHERMPLILLPEHEKLWLENELPSTDLKNLILPYPEDAMEWYEVSSSVNSPRNDRPDLIEPAHHTRQGELFS